MKAQLIEFQNSTVERRLVTLVKGAPKEIYSAGRTYGGSLFNSTDYYAFVNMTTQKKQFVIGDQLYTSDGVGVEAKFTINYHIKDVDDRIRRAIVNFTGEQDLLVFSITKRLQNFIKEIKSVDVSKKVASATEMLIEQLQSIDAESDSCFYVRNISINSLSILNDDINQIISKSIKDIETEYAHNEVTKIKLAMAGLEQEFKLSEAKGQIELDKIKAQNELELQKLKEQHSLENQFNLEKQKLELDKLRRDDDLTHKLKEADALQTDQGKFALFPAEMFNVLKKELELKYINDNDKHKILKEFSQLVFNSDQSRKAGQLSTMQAFLARYLNVEFTEQSNTDITKQVEDYLSTRTNKLAEGASDN